MNRIALPLAAFFSTLLLWTGGAGASEAKVTDVQEVPIDVAQSLSNVERKPGGFVTCWLLDSDKKRPRPTSMVDAYKKLGVQSVRFPYGHLANNYLWTTPPYHQAVKGLTPRVASKSQAPAHWNWAANPDGTFRKDLDFDEFITQCRKADIEPVIVINVLSHTYQGGPSVAELREAAVEWVRYANVTRKYGVKYWQIGNEQDHHAKRLSMEEYKEIYGDFAKAMHAVDPTIQTGVAIIGNAKWAKTILDAFPEYVDFVGCHQYQWRGWDVQTWRDFTDPVIGNLLKTDRVIDQSARPDAEIMVTEFSPWGRWYDGKGGKPDMLRMLCFSEMLLHAATLKRVAYTHFWGTHSPWVGENVHGGLSSALTPDNEITPPAQVIGLVNNNLGDAMVQADRVKGSLRTFASYSKADGQLTVFIINKSDQPVEAALILKGFSPQQLVERLVFAGERYDDLTPVKSTDNKATLQNKQVSTTVPGISMTILKLRNGQH